MRGDCYWWTGPRQWCQKWDLHQKWVRFGLCWCMHFGQCYRATNTVDMTVPREWERQWAISDRKVRREPRQGAAPQLKGLQTNLKMKQYCYSCGRRGHMAMSCPSIAESLGRPKTVRGGLEKGHQVQGILLNIGCSRMQVWQVLVPPERMTRGRVSITEILFCLQGLTSLCGSKGRKFRCNQGWHQRSSSSSYAGYWCFRVGDAVKVPGWLSDNAACDAGKSSRSAEAEGSSSSKKACMWVQMWC